MKERKSGLALHVHHNIPWEWLWDYKERVAVIKRDKPYSEQGLRLRLLKIIPLEQLPEELLEAATEREKAWAKWEKADMKYNKVEKKWENAGEEWGEEWEKERGRWEKAEVVFYTVLKKYNPEIEALHKELCPNCPWDGQTIFPEK